MNGEEMWWNLAVLSVTKQIYMALKMDLLIDLVILPLRKETKRRKSPFSMQIMCGYAAIEIH